ncbi:MULTISPECIES: sensor histidine kinase [Streptomyces]|uniref:histidine kinase n=1 Tax=Streptomyces dengpaensis TaxID=2049881 RepID=A0ABM6SX01_9ACTN|nr:MULTISPECIES: ATP-binding protein [Streptomyces]AVH59074.1 sensor histidine kinase [Streptomyces dengpaensis]
MAVLAAAVVVFVLQAQAGTADATTFGVLAGGAVLGCSVLFFAARAASVAAKRITERHTSLRRTVAQGVTDLQNMVLRLERGELVEQPLFAQPAPPTNDPFSRLAYELTISHLQAQAAIAHAAQLAQGTASDNEESIEVFVNLARRLQSLVHRQISMLDRLENEVEDPELLKGLFQVDHLATRIRRHAENVAVLGGSASRRQWTKPVTMMEVLRSSIAEVEHYSRVKLVPPLEGTLRGHAVADVIHLLAELVENATGFSDPNTQVLLRAQRVTAGLAIEVEDRGLGLSQEEQDRINSLLAYPDSIDISKLLADGRIGLYVVSALARRHGIAVRLQGNIYGGIQAVLVLPRGLLGDEPDEAPHHAAAAAPRPVQPASPQRPAVQAGPEARYVPPPLDTAQPMARSMGQAQQMAAQTPPPQQQTPQHARPAERPAPRDPGPYDTEDPRIGRPPLPQRRAQEHLAPQLRNTPTTRMTGDMPQGEHDPGLMAAFQRGVSLADDVPDETR